MKHDILRLDVSMDYPQGVDLFHSLTNLANIASHLQLGHWLVLLKLVEQLATCANLQNDVDITFVIKITEHFNDVWVIKEHLYF